MKRITIGAGTGRDKNGLPIGSTDREQARKTVSEFATDLFGGVTFFYTYGAWREPAGNVVNENGWSVVVYAETDQWAEALAVKVRDALNQQMVYLVVEDIAARMV